MWSGCFFGLGIYYDWFGIFSAFLWSVMYWVGSTISGLLTGLIFSAIAKHWFLTAIGYICVLAGLAMLLIHSYNLDPMLSLIFHGVLSVLLLIFSKRSIQKKNEEDRNLRISPALQNLIKKYDISDLDADLLSCSTR